MVKYMTDTFGDRATGKKETDPKIDVVGDRQ